MNKKTLLAAVLLAATAGAAHAQVSLSINIAPPPLPVYVQPVIPAPGYIWTPGYWRWSPADGDYYWVPGTWVAPPYVGALWTPGYWGWGGGGYAWHAGYWGRTIGFYGGVNYGFGYVGHGYQGGYWNGGVFNYNRSVNNINTTIVRNVYNTRVVETTTRVSYNGGQGGINARPTSEERAVQGQPHTPPTALQRQHEAVASRTPEQRVSMNHGSPTFAASTRPGDVRNEHPERAAPGEHVVATAPRPGGRAQHAGPGPAHPQFGGAPHPYVPHAPMPHGEPGGGHPGGGHPGGGEPHGGGEHREGGRER